jgi:hypothetical protein
MGPPRQLGVASEVAGKGEVHSYGGVAVTVEEELSASLGLVVIARPVVRLDAVSKPAVAAELECIGNRRLTQARRAAPLPL